MFNLGNLGKLRAGSKGEGAKKEGPSRTPDTIIRSLVDSFEDADGNLMKTNVSSSVTIGRALDAMQKLKTNEDMEAYKQFYAIMFSKRGANLKNRNIGDEDPIVKSVLSAAKEMALLPRFDVFREEADALLTKHEENN